MDPANLLELPGIVELFGEAGSGKSQFCHYLSAAFVSKNTTRRALYLSLDSKYRSVPFFEYISRLSTLPSQMLGNNVLIYQQYDSELALEFLTQKLAKTCESKNIGLVIIDSLAGVFRLSEQSANRFLLFEIMKLLRGIHLKLGSTIVIVNQVSAKVGFDIDSGLSEDLALPFKPALGLQWSNCVDHRLWICKEPGGKSTNCKCLRSPMLPPGTVFTLLLQTDTFNGQANSTSD